MLASSSRRLAATAAASPSFARRALFSTDRQPFLPRITERRANETGPGGRGSNAGVKVAVFGASGFLGRYVCCHLGTNGVMAYLGNRGDEFDMRWLKPMFELGRARFAFYSSRDRQSMADLIADADVVINLVGKYYETRALADKPKFPYLEYKVNTTFRECNVDVPRTIAELCAEMQVDNLVHVSCAAADPDSSSEWARTKHEGERAVLDAYPWATIVRPTQLFGPEDRFLNWFANAARRFRVVPLIDGGHALTQPVYMDDVAKVIARIVDDPEKFEGRRIDCFGPVDYAYRELSQFVYDITGQNPAVAEMPKSVVKNISKVLQYQGRPMLTPDLVELWSEDYLPDMTQEEYDAQTNGNENILTMKDLDIEATPIEKVAFNYLHRFRAGGHFVLAGGYH